MVLEPGRSTMAAAGHASAAEQWLSCSATTVGFQRSPDFIDSDVAALKAAAWLVGNGRRKRSSLLGDFVNVSLQE